MAIRIIIEEDAERQVEMTLEPEHHDDKEWEEVCYQLGCAVAMEIAKRWLFSIEERLYQEHPKSIEVEGFRERARETRFGKLDIQRRLYRDDQGEYHFLLDEHLSWPAYRRATPDLTESLVDSSTRASFREVTRDEKYSTVTVSRSTVHRLVQEVAKTAIRVERKEWEACFEEGSLPPSGSGKASVLYTEADGLWLHTQRESQKHCELKNAITYEGWERLPQKEERYRLVNKKVYCQSDSSIPFWEGIGLLWHKYWDLAYTDLIVLGGDDSEWIDSGVDELGSSCIRQLSGFHLARSCRRGWEKGKELYDVIRCGDIQHTLGDYGEREGKTAQKAREYVVKRLEKGRDWRKKVSDTALASKIPEDARGLGAIEGNEFHLFADRMKDRGMSWTIAGARHMGKVIELAANGDLKRWCGRNPPDEQKQCLSFDLFDSQADPENRAGIPALEGPHASRHWVKVVKDLTSASYRLL